MTDLLESPDAAILADLRAFVAAHPQTANARVDVLLRRAISELERLNPAGADRD